MTFLTPDISADDPVRRYSEIPRVDMVIRDRAGKLRAVRFNSSFSLFWRLEDIGRHGEDIVYFAQAGRSLAGRSLGALNVFLRVGRGLRYWKRQNGEKHRWAWASFVAHLGLKFK